VGTTSVFSPLSAVEERQRYGTYSLFPPVVEAEGMDRQDLLLPGRQLNIIQVWVRVGGPAVTLCRAEAQTLHGTLLLCWV